VKSIVLCKLASSRKSCKFLGISPTNVPTLSDRQALIRGILLATEEETRLYFTNLEHNEGLLEELDSRYKGWEYGIFA